MSWCNWRDLEGDTNKRPSEPNPVGAWLFMFTIHGVCLFGYVVSCLKNIIQFLQLASLFENLLGKKPTSISLLKGKSEWNIMSDCQTSFMMLFFQRRRLPPDYDSQPLRIQVSGESLFQATNYGHQYLCPWYLTAIRGKT